MPAAHHVEIAGEEADHAIRHNRGQLHQQIAVVTYDGCTHINQQCQCTERMHEINEISGNCASY